MYDISSKQSFAFYYSMCSRPSHAWRKTTANEKKRLHSFIPGRVGLCRHMPNSAVSTSLDHTHQCVYHITEGPINNRWQLTCFGERSTVHFHIGLQKRSCFLSLAALNIRSKAETSMEQSACLGDNTFTRVLPVDVTSAAPDIELVDLDRTYALPRRTRRCRMHCLQ